MYGKYDLVGVLENIGTGNIQEFFDPHGNELDYYYVRVGDNFGNISSPSDIASASGQVPPPTVKSLNATSGQGFGSILYSGENLLIRDLTDITYIVPKILTVVSFQ